jgi:copper(I)-binding protein
MRALNFLLFSVFFMFNLNTAASADEYKLGDLEVVDPWGHAPLKGTDVAEGFLKIVNHGATADRLVAVTVDFAKTAQIHEMKMNGTTMQMAELKDGLEIPAGATVELKPQSTHLMFMGLTRRPAANEKAAGELTFEKAGKLKVEFMIEPAGAGGSMPMNMDNTNNMNMNAN